MAHNDITWSAAVVDILQRFTLGEISEAAAALELADATSDWPTRSMSNADLATRIQDLIQEVQDTRSSGMIGYKTWAELEAHPVENLKTGDVARIFEDPGTHADPVTAVVVANEGLYTYRATGTVGWEWVSDILNSGQYQDVLNALEEANTVVAVAAEAVNNVNGARVVNFAGAAATEGQAIHGSSIASPDTRYDVSVDSNGYLQIDFIAAAIERVGWRNLAAAHKIGRVFSQTTEFTAANFAGTNAAAGFVFTDLKSTGAQANAGADALYFYLRVNGVLQIITDAGTVAPGYVLTLVGSTALPTIAAGEVASFTYKKNENNTGTITAQKGAVVSTYSITPAPPHALVGPVIRSSANGTGVPGHASNWKPKLRSFQWADTSITQNINQTTQNTINNIAAALSPALADYGSPIRYAEPDVECWTRRVRPSYFPSLPVTVVAVWGPGSVLTDRSIVDAYLATHPELALNGVAYASDATGGAPGTGALNDQTKPYTMDYAVRKTPAQIIVQLDSVCKPIDFRETDDYGHLRKIIVPLHRGSAYWAITPTDDVTTLTWTATGGHANTWQATYVGNPGGVGIHRMTHTGVFDDKGFPARARKCASLVELDAVPRGVYVDTATKTVYMKWDGQSIQTIKSSLKAYWYDAAGNSRASLLGGVELGIYGIIFDGVSVAFIPGVGLPTLWIDNCLSQFAPTYGIGDVVPSGATLYAGRIRMHASEYDGISLNPHVSGSALGLLINSHISNAGDYEAFGLAGSANKQAVSLHGGRFARIGNYFEDCFGQQIADASTDPTLNGSWNVGNIVRDDTGLANGNIGWSFSGHVGDGNSARDHVAVVDTCAAVGSNITKPLHIESGASCFIFNSPGLLPASVYDGSVQPVAYTPGNPP